MTNTDIYQNIAARTGGDIYLGVVGPVRTGKSTFIKRFMDLMVLPRMEDSEAKKRTIDELPQSAQGKTIMTTEPKFIPKDAVRVLLDENLPVRIRLPALSCGISHWSTPSARARISCTRGPQKPP